MNFSEGRKFTIDAEGKSLGRVASAAATLLMGKDTPSFVRHRLTGSAVEIVNASKIKLTGKKSESKVYKFFSGYPGGLRTLRASQMIEKKGQAALIIRAVHGMIPANRLRDQIMKSLTIKL